MLDRMGVWYVARRLLSSWIAFILALLPLLTFLFSFIAGGSEGVKRGLIVAFAMLLAIGFLRRGYSPNRLWNFVYTLWAGYLLLLLALVILAFLTFGILSVVGVASKLPSEASRGGQTVIGVLGSLTCIILYLVAYRKTVGENNETY